MSFLNFFGGFAVFNAFCDLFSSKQSPTYLPPQDLYPEYDYEDRCDELQGRIDELQARINSLEDADDIRDELDDLQAELDDLELDRDLFRDDDW